MKKIDIGDLNSLDDVDKYQKNSLFVLNDDKVIQPPESLNEKKDAAGQ